MTVPSPSSPQGYLVSFGPDANCTLATCPVQWSVYEYRPSLAANVVLMVLFVISMILSLYQGFRWRTWTFTGPMFGGYVTELVGYGGRIMLHNNPFSFTGFMVQIVCITLAPVFFTSSIYLTLAKITYYLDPTLTITRFNPKLYYYIFIPCDIISLALQGTGGGLSTTSSGTSQTAVNIAIAGLSFQVITLTVFSALAIDFGIRFLLHRKRRNQGTITTSTSSHKLNTTTEEAKLTRTFKLFIFFLIAAILLIFVRCAYRIDELSDGYNGPLIREQGLFIALEGVMIVLAVFCLNACYPGLGVVFQHDEANRLQGQRRGDVERREISESAVEK